LANRVLKIFQKSAVEVFELVDVHNRFMIVLKRNVLRVYVVLHYICMYIFAFFYVTFLYTSVYIFHKIKVSNLLLNVLHFNLIIENRLSTTDLLFNVLLLYYFLLHVSSCICYIARL